MAQKPIILALETSSRVGSVALGIGEKMLAETTFSEPLKHSAEIFPSISELIGRFGYKPNQIKHVYISIGPGSFTGLRIATTMAKMMYLANNVKVVTVNTLDVIAANIIEAPHESITVNHDIKSAEMNCQQKEKELMPIDSINRIAAILDAKRGHFFIAIYECNQNKKLKSIPTKKWEKVLTDSVMSPEQFLNKYVTGRKSTWLLGDGLVYYKERFRTEGVIFLDQRYWSPKASVVYQLGRQKAQQALFTDPVSMTPLYLLRPDIKIKAL